MNMLKAVGAHSRDPLANVVFVHGIGSSSEKAWRSPNSAEKAAFPEWLSQDLTEHARAPVNVWLVDYPAEIFRVMFLSVSRDDSVPQRADMLRDLVSSQQLTRRPVIFIGHSLGGLLVKDMLRGSIDMRQYPRRRRWNSQAIQPCPQHEARDLHLNAPRWVVGREHSSDCSGSIDGYVAGSLRASELAAGVLARQTHTRTDFQGRGQAWPVYRCFKETRSTS